MLAGNPFQFRPAETGKRRENVQRILHHPFGPLLAGKRNLPSLGLGQAVPGVWLDGARGIFVGGGRKSGGGADRDE